MDIPHDIMEDLNRNKTTVILSTWQFNNKKLVEQFKSMGYNVIEDKKVPSDPKK